MPIIGSPVPADPEVLILDPVTEDAANSELVISTSPYGLLEHHYPQPPVSAQWSSSVDTEGARLASIKHDNRQIQISLDVEGLDALRDLQDKLGKFHREGGTLHRTLGDATVIVFDVLTVEGYDPSYDLTFTLGGILNVQFTLTCLPYGRGPEETLSSHAETSLPWSVFTEASIKGDMPARGRLVITEAQAQAQALVLWGVQSRNYDSASTAALAYQAEACAVISPSATAVGAAGASGSGSNVVRNTNLGAGWSGLCYIGASATAQTHIGTFRVFARFWAPVTNTGTVSVRCAWKPYVGAPDVTNTQIDLDPTGVTEGYWMLADLGQVTLPKATVGTQGWIGRVEAISTIVGDDVDVDWIMLVPASEGSGEIRGVGDQNVDASGSVQIRHDGVYVSRSGGYWARPSSYEGDYLLVPPAGAEGRTLRVITKMARGVLIGGPGTPLIYDTKVMTDPAADDITVQMFYTPRYLSVPSA